MRNMNVKIFMLIILAFSSWASAQDRIESQAAEATLKNAWNIVNSEYPMFVIRDQLDWDALRSKYLTEAKKARTYQEVGTVVDVRWNSGGDSELSKYIAARFVDTTRTYSYYRYRNGPNRTDFTEKIERTLSLREPWRYNRPVILLMGQIR